MENFLEALLEELRRICSRNYEKKFAELPGATLRKEFLVELLRNSWRTSGEIAEGNILKGFLGKLWINYKRNYKENPKELPMELWRYLGGYAEKIKKIF